MDKTTLISALLMSEKNNSVVAIKMINTDKLVVGAVQKVLNQIIILKSAAAHPITLTVGDIESVTHPADTQPESFFEKLPGAFRAMFRR